MAVYAVRYTKGVEIMEYLSPLRYPGGKAKVSDFIQSLISANSLFGGVYVEPM